MKRYLWGTAAFILIAVGLMPTVSGQSGRENGTVWKHPNGLYSLRVPSRWNTIESNGSLKITNGTTWAIFDTATDSGSAMDVAQKAAGNMQKFVTDWHVTNQGPFTTTGNHTAGGLTATCALATKTGSSNRLMMFAAQGAGGGHYVLMIASTDAATSKEMTEVLIGVFNSVRFGGV